MTGTAPEMTGNAGPWQRYMARERAAREAYLAITSRAQHEYLLGPWPDRESYHHVEQSAWITYYTAGREAWRHYTAELNPPPPPPATVTPGPIAQQKANEWADRMNIAQPYPTYTEHDGGEDRWLSS